MMSELKPFGLRIPPDLKQFITARAAENGRSLNSEILQLIKAARDGKGSPSHG